MIKKASIDDVSVLVGISLRSFDTAWSKTSFEAEFAKDFSHTYIYIKDDQPIAFLIVWVLQNEGEVVSLAVDQNWRNKGVGSRMLRSVLNMYPDVETWAIEVDPQNTVAVHVYEKNMFKRTRTIKNYYGQGKDAVQMNRRG